MAVVARSRLFLGCNSSFCFGSGQHSAPAPQWGNAGSHINPHPAICSAAPSWQHTNQPAQRKYLLSCVLRTRYSLFQQYGSVFSATRIVDAPIDCPIDPLPILPPPTSSPRLDSDLGPSRCSPALHPFNELIAGSVRRRYPGTPANQSPVLPTAVISSPSAQRGQPIPPVSRLQTPVHRDRLGLRRVAPQPLIALAHF